MNEIRECLTCGLYGVGGRCAASGCRDWSQWIPAEHEAGVATTADTGGALYEKLRGVLDRAFDHASKGKGHERHDDGRVFEEQPSAQIARLVGTGYTRGQAMKKIVEAGRLPKDRAVLELLGAINYVALDILVLEGK